MSKGNGFGHETMKHLRIVRKDGGRVTLNQFQRN